MSRPHLLLLDPDAASRESLAAELMRTGVDVTSAGELGVVPKDLEAQATVAVDGGMLAPETLEQLHAEGRPLFVVLQTPSAEREQALLNLGVLQVLPAGPELAAEIARVLASSPEPTEMEGPFAPESLLASVDHVGARSAVITCTAESGDIGTLWMRDGRIIDVQLAALAPGRALARLFTWRSGRCHLLIGPHEHEEAIALDAHLGAEEAMRRADVWHRLVASLGGIDSVFRVDYVALARQLADVPDDANVILRLVDSERTLAAIIDQVPFDELHTLAVTLRLRVDGVLVPAKAFEPLAVVEAARNDSADTVVDTGTGPPLITVQAIDEALAWVAAPSMVPWTPTRGHIPVVQYTGHRGTRRERMEQSALEMREKAAQLDGRPLLLSDEVLAPGMLPFVSAPTQDRTEILVSAARSPVSEPDEPSRWVTFAMAGVAVVLGGIVVIQSLRAETAPEPASVEAARPAPAAPPLVVKPVAPDPPPVAVVPPAPPAPVPVPAAPTAPPVAAPKPPAKPAVPAAATYESLLKAGAQANAQEQPAKAIPLLEQAVAKKKTPTALLELGKAYHASGKLTPAIDTLKQATAMDPKLATAFMYLGMACQEAHKADDAKAAYKRFLELEPAESARHHEIESVLRHL